MKYSPLLLFLILTKLGFSQATCEVRIADSTAYQELEAQITVAMVTSTKSTTEVTCHQIRTVVHVVYNGSISEGYYRGEISPEQVRSQLRITNQFLNNDSLMYSSDNAVLGYQLVLAGQDPNGNPTSGIVYHNGTALFGSDWSTYGLQNNNPNAISASMLSDAIAWGTDLNGKKYLNTYVVSSIDGNTGGGVQAFAYFPTSNTVFGNYNLFNTFGAEQLENEFGQSFDLKSYTDQGLTFTHELLHNLALFHTFQGNSCAPELSPTIQGDRVIDTPPQTQGSGCFGSCGFLSYNVMDYISQNCKDRITPGQVIRAHLAISNSLADYLVCDTGCNTGIGDFNGDGYVSLTDMSLMNIQYGAVMGNPDYNSEFDLNCDGNINILDVSIMQLD